VVREIWFIVTLITHSSGVSSSGVSRGIHHKCKHPLNLTRLYVSGWVESNRSVLIWNAITCLGDVCMWDCDRIYDWLMKSFGSSLPFCFCCVSCCVVLPFAMIINLLMWADARDTRGQQGGDGSAKWEKNTNEFLYNSLFSSKK